MSSQQRFIKQDVGGELLLFDKEEKVTHLLTAEYRSVYELSEAGKSLAVVAAITFPDLAEDERNAKCAAMLGELRAKKIVRNSDLFSRRDFGALAAKVAVVPAIATILAPMPAAAQSQCGGMTIFDFVPVALSGTGQITQSFSVSICLGEGSNRVGVGFPSGNGTVDELFTITTSGPGSAAGSFSVSSVAPTVPFCPSPAIDAASFQSQASGGNDISALFAFPGGGGGPLTPTVTGDFCHGDVGSNYALPRLRLIVGYS